jgi:hypothetical protein
MMKEFNPSRAVEIFDFFPSIWRLTGIAIFAGKIYTTTKDGVFSLIIKDCSFFMNDVFEALVRK